MRMIRSQFWEETSICAAFNLCAASSSPRRHATRESAWPLGLGPCRDS